MKRPAPVNYVIGNSLVMVIMTGLTLYFGYLALVGVAQWPAPLMFLVFASVSHKANERIREYASWKKRWDSYNDTGTRPPLWKQPAFGSACVFVGVGIFIWFDAQSAEAQNAAKALALVIGVLAAGIGFAIWITMKFKARPAKAKADPVVSLCLPKPSSDRKVIDRAYAALPPHCQAILRSNTHER